MHSRLFHNCIGLNIFILTSSISSLHWSFSCFLCCFCSREYIPSIPPHSTYIIVFCNFISLFLKSTKQISMSPVSPVFHTVVTVSWSQRRVMKRFSRNKLQWNKNDIKAGKWPVETTQLQASLLYNTGRDKSFQWYIFEIVCFTGIYNSSHQWNSNCYSDSQIFGVNLVRDKKVLIKLPNPSFLLHKFETSRQIRSMIVNFKRCHLMYN